MNILALLVVAAVGQTPSSVTINWGQGLGRGHVISHTDAFNGTYSLSGGVAVDMTKDAQPVWVIGQGYVSKRPGIRILVSQAPGGGWGVSLQTQSVDNLADMTWRSSGGSYGASRTLPMIILVPQFPGDTGHFIRVD